MKKTICAVLLLLFAFSLCSCDELEKANLYGRKISNDEFMARIQDVYRGGNNRQILYEEYIGSDGSLVGKPLPPLEERAVIRVKAEQVYCREYPAELKYEDVSFHGKVSFYWTECTVLEVVNAGTDIQQYLSEQGNTVYLWNGATVTHKQDGLTYRWDNLYKDLSTVLFAGMEYELLAYFGELSIYSLYEDDIKAEIPQMTGPVITSSRIRCMDMSFDDYREFWRGKVCLGNKENDLYDKNMSMDEELWNRNIESWQKGKK